MFKNLGSKGSEETEDIIHQLPKILLAGLFIFLVLFTISRIFPEFSQSNQVQYSAFTLTEAINEVYTHSVDLGENGYTKKVNITLPVKGKEDYKFIAGFSDRRNYSPKWIVYSGMKAADIYTVTTSWYEILHDATSGPTSGGREAENIAKAFEELPQYCDHVCFGFARRTKLPELELINPAKVENFWITNPCFAEVEVYYDDKVKLRFTQKLQGGNNYCCDNNKLLGDFVDSHAESLPIIGDLIQDAFDTEWPEGGDAFKDGGRGCHQGLI